MVGIRQQNAIGQGVLRAMREGEAARRNALGAQQRVMRHHASASTARSRGMAASSAFRKPLQVLISAGVGRFSGGTQRTAFTMRQPSNSIPSFGSSRNSPRATPNFSSVP